MEGAGGIEVEEGAETGGVGQEEVEGGGGDGVRRGGV